MGKLAVLLGALLVGVVVGGGGLWYNYATRGKPDDGVGVMLNSAMPKPLRTWACDRVHERYPKALKPAGC